MPVRALTAAFWVVLAATVGWMVLSVQDYGLVAGPLGEKGSRLVTTLLMGALAFAAGHLLLHHRRSAGDEDYWSGWELVYALALFLALLYGVYSFFGWFFYA